MFEIPLSYGYEGFGLGGGDTASGGEKLKVIPSGQSENQELLNAIKQLNSNMSRLPSELRDAMLTR
jgi:hypothetical protein